MHHAGHYSAGITSSDLYFIWLPIPPIITAHGRPGHGRGPSSELFKFIEWSVHDVLTILSQQRCARRSGPMKGAPDRTERGDAPIMPRISGSFSEIEDMAVKDDLDFRSLKPLDEERRPESSGSIRREAASSSFSSDLHA